MCNKVSAGDLQGGQEVENITIYLHLPERYVARYKKHCHQIVAFVLVTQILQKHTGDGVVLYLCHCGGCWWFRDLHLDFLGHFGTFIFVQCHCSQPTLHYCFTISASCIESVVFLRQ